MINLRHSLVFVTVMGLGLGCVAAPVSEESAEEVGQTEEALSVPLASPGSRLTGFAVNGTLSRTYFEGSDNHVYELWYDGATWHHGDLTQRAAAPSAAPGTSLVGFTVTGGLSRVYFQGANNHIYELWYDSLSWHYADLTQWAGAPSATTGAALTGFTVNGDLSRVYFQDANNHVHELWYDSLNWHDADLTQWAGAPSAAAGTALTGFTVTGGQSRVYFQDANNHIHELWYDSLNWHDADLTQWAGAPSTAASTALTGFTVNGDLSRVYFQDANNHVHELWYDSLNWHDADLTQWAGAPSAAASTALTGFTVTGDLSRVYFQGANNHVHELWYDSLNWHDADLTQWAGAPLTEPRSPLTGFVVSGDQSRTYFLGADSHVNELWYDDLNWYSRDLSATSD